jgi:acyl-CoA reductase-like NAD-dependent aldehyde dehydrogenase
MTINGEMCVAPAAIDVINPATGAVFATAPACSSQQLDQAVESAARAFVEWRRVPLAERQAALFNAGELLLAHVDEMAALFTREQGRPTAGARIEIESAGNWLKAVSRMSPPEHVIEDSAERLVETRYVPLGVVCAIAPWNFPVTLSVWKIAPALLAGNTMVLKPSPFTPLCTLKMGELFAPVFPPGVLNVISGGDALGPLMTAHPGFAKIAFTGSTATGKSVMRSAANDLKRLTLELGGNDAAIVMPDVDLNAVAPKLFFGAFFNSAQICIASKRLYVHDAIYDALLDRFAELAVNFTMGDGSQAGTMLGPIQNRRQYDRVRALLDEARDAGLKLIQGQAPEGSGYFLPVTIVDNPPDDARVVTEEAFGPILPMMRFTDVEDAIRRANDCPYGLAGAVWSQDEAFAMTIARRLETGTVWINQNLSVRPDAPFAGHKQSGFGIENGVEGLLEYMLPQVVHVARAPRLASEPTE